jgi:hypothetical protein
MSSVTPRSIRSAVVTCALTAVLVLAAVARPVRAQILEVPVFDLSNFLQDLEQVYYLTEELSNMILQAQSLPLDMFVRYHVTFPSWTLNPTQSLFQAAGALLSALNVGDPSGGGYRQAVEPLDLPTDVFARMPAALQRRFLDDYATIQLADSVATTTIDQNGAARIGGNKILQVLQAMESDAFSTDRFFNTETALLNKINSASVVGIKEQEQSNQFLSSALEQLVVDNKRTRDTEAKLMNASIHQWRYGTTYAQDLFSRTASGIEAFHVR